ncbi:MAG TPA: glucuronate isomerase [Blastocatellia bacterium]|nr:glucuronate isomerase [Blastocatellia bacterium]
MSNRTKINLPEDRYFDTDPKQKEVALELYHLVKDKPLVCPHGHVDPQMFADPDYRFGSPTDLLLIPDHYVFRMLYSQGIPMESLGIARLDGTPVESDHRKIWQVFADNYHLFRGTPTGMWLAHELKVVFGVEENLCGANAREIYDHIAAQLEKPEFRPRRLFEKFNIEVLATTDAADDPLVHHQALRKSGWKARIVPTFRPDGVVNIDRPDWQQNIRSLGRVSGIEINSYQKLITVLEGRREYFKSLGATATDHAALTPFTDHLLPQEADSIFQRALKGEADPRDAQLFTGHMLMEMARMSVEDGLVMQFHAGSWRNHNQLIFDRFGYDKGSDIPIQTDYTRSMLPLLNKYGNDTRLTLILFTLDETTYSRELAPIAGHYPAVKLGPPWWFHDSWNGMKRFREQVMETAGLYNTVGFNDDTRAFPSIPARHDLARRCDANWLANLVVRSVIDRGDAEEMIHDCAYRLARKAYKFEQSSSAKPD